MKSYQIIDKKTNIPEYIIKHDVNDNAEEIYQLCYSYNRLWRDDLQGTVAITMIDSGNDIKFKPQLPKTFDYGIFEKVRVLMQFQEKIKTSLQAEYTIIEEKLIAEI